MLTLRQRRQLTVMQSHRPTRRLHTVNVDPSAESEPDGEPRRRTRQQCYLHNLDDTAEQFCLNTPVIGLSRRYVSLFSGLSSCVLQ